MIYPENRPMPQFSDINGSFDEFLIASGVGKVIWKISDVCMITTDEWGRSLRFAYLDDEFEDE